MISVLAILATAASAQTTDLVTIRGLVLQADGTPAVAAHIGVYTSDGTLLTSVRTSTRGVFLVLSPPQAAAVLRAADAEGKTVAELEFASGPEQVRDCVLTLHATLPAPATGANVPSKFEQLPLTNRDAESLAQLDSIASEGTLAEASDSVSQATATDQAAQRSDAEAGGSGVGPSIAGMSPIQNEHLFDGLSAAQSFRPGPRGAAAGGPRVGASFGEASLGALRVLPRTYSARYGGAAGGVIAATSHTAPERLHLGSYLRGRSSDLAATNPYAAVTHFRDGVITGGLVKPSDTRLQFGVSGGAALPRVARPAMLRKLGVFASLEGQHRAGELQSSPANPDFYRLSAMQTALLGNRGVTASAIRTGLNYLDSLTGGVPLQENRTLGFARADSEIGTRDRTTLSYTRHRFSSPVAAAVGTSDAVINRGRSSVGDSRVHVDAITGRWSHTFSPRWSHELRGQAARDLDFEEPRAPLPQEPATAPGGFAPQVSIAPDGLIYGTPAGLGRRAYPDEHRVQLANALIFTTRQHSFTAGADWSRLHDRVSTLENDAGTFTYDSGSTNGRAGGLVDWLTDFTFSANSYPNGGCPSITAAVHLFCFRSFTQSFGSAETKFVTHDFAGFVEDSWCVRNGLTLTLGVRYDYTLLPFPQKPNRALDNVFASRSLVDGATASIPEDRNNFGPRLAVAWAPRGGRLFVAQASYGAFYGRLPGATVRAALVNTALPSATTHIRITPGTTVACPQVANQGFGYPCAFVTAPPAAVAQTTSATLFARSFRLPAVQRATLGLEHDFSLGAPRRRLLLRAEYAAAIATQLPGSVDRNLAPATSAVRFVLQGVEGQPGLSSGQSFSVPLYTERLSSQYGPVSALVSHSNATYHAVTAEARLRGLASIEARASYTFSRAIDYNPQLSAAPRVSTQFDPREHGYDKGLSSLQFPHRFAGDLLYTSRWSRGSHLARASLTGWRAAAIGYVSSGAPYSYQVFGGTGLSGGQESLNGSGGATFLPTVGRNTLHLPMRARLDARLGREVALPAALRLNVFLEAFNVLNTRNVSGVESRAFLPGTPTASTSPTPLVFQSATAIAAEGITARPFGAATSSITGLGRERELQFGVRLDF